MKITKLLLAGALALALAACHEPGHEWCDIDDDGDTDGACVALVVGAGAVAKFLVVSSLNDDEVID